MKKKPRNVDVISVNLTFSRDDHNLTFADVLNVLENNTKHLEGKIIHFSKVPTELEDCIIGLIVTTQDKDIPPKRDKTTGQFSPVEINPSTEGLAFANIFIYDIRRSILIYEINRNGCYLRLFRDFIYAVCKDAYPDVSFDIKFPVLLRGTGYRRMLEMTYYKKLVLEIYNPSTLISQFNEENDSIPNCVRNYIDTSRDSRANTIVIEQLVKYKRLNPTGLSRQWVKGITDWIRSFRGTEIWPNIENLKIEGYTIDPESNNKRTTIDILKDCFREHFFIPEVFIQSDVQQTDRKDGIEMLYRKLLPEFNELYTP